MPRFEIVKKTDPDYESFRVSSIAGQFGIEPTSITEKFEGEVDLDRDWKVGVICGPSGSGKTTIAKELFPSSYFVAPKYQKNSVIDDMPSSSTITEISKMFTSVGFGSVPSWLKPYSVLSNGEKMRVDLAYALLDDKENQPIVFDEFTSVIDRKVAKTGSHCVQKNIRKGSKQFIAVSCHYDIVDWLEPDWVFDTATMQFAEAKKKGSILKSSSMSPTRVLGNCLKNIII